MDTKICLKCGAELPATTEHFYSHKSYRDGLTTSCKRCAGEYAKQYYASNKSKILNVATQYYKENRKERLQYQRMYMNGYVGSGRQSVIRQRRKAKNRLLPYTLTFEQWEEIKSKFNNRCAYCGSEKKLEQDHFVAISRGGGYTPQNIVPACKSCNSRKCHKDFFTWYPLQSFYSKERESFLLKHIEELSKESI